MDKNEYLTTLNTIHLIASIVKDIDLAGFIEAGLHAETMGPILDPTLYRAKSQQLKEDIAMAQQLQGFKSLLREGSKP